VSRHLDDLDAVLESDSLNDFRQLILPSVVRQVSAAAVTSLNTINLAVVADRRTAPLDATPIVSPLPH
jgi:hypothetical protein